MYLGADDNFNQKLYNYIPKKYIKKRNKKNKFLILQKSIELEIQNDILSQNNCSDLNKKIFLTTQNYYNNENNNSKNNLIRSRSVDDYSNLEDFFRINKISKNSKEIDEHFINGIKDNKRKNNLLNSLNFYKKYKFLKKKGRNNYSNILTIGSREPNLKNIEKKYDIKNKDNIIIEDENQNYENDTLYIKNNNFYIDKKIQSQISKNNLNDWKKIKNNFIEEKGEIRKIKFF